MCESEHSIRKNLFDAQSAKETFKGREYLVKFKAFVFARVQYENVSEIKIISIDTQEFLYSWRFFSQSLNIFAKIQKSEKLHVHYFLISQN